MIDLQQETDRFDLSPSLQVFQAMQDGRKEPTEMAETSYELFLKDVVDDGRKIEVKQDTKKKSERNNKKSTLKRHSRSQSMNDEVFLLKMFFPSCLSCKKKTTTENHSKVSLMPFVRCIRETNG
ncbi:hypothetical protein POM88_037530 [Heracleum sosnowskyi]|uniref:Uncharacterized protein n=1 Tax=Heracleum sosnowskyi TaxID=360622 RepID=A0AAD8HRA2_9APIA|nr:hypothetical protein POM88_037530 [Heracleum sosnowskyi]